MKCGSACYPHTDLCPSAGALDNVASRLSALTGDPSEPVPPLGSSGGEGVPLGKSQGSNSTVVPDGGPERRVFFHNSALHMSASPWSRGPYPSE